MTIPAPSSPVWTRLASGGLSRIQTSHLGTQMLIKRLELAPTEFFKPSTGTSSEMMYDPTTRELPPYILPQWEILK